MIGWPRTPKRRAKPRRGPLRNLLYRMWVAKLPSVGCFPLAYRDGKVRLYIMSDPDFYFGPIRSQAAHTENNGTSSKGPDSSCVPLCPTHHADYDSGLVIFQIQNSIDLKAIAAELWAKYRG